MAKTLSSFMNQIRCFDQQRGKGVAAGAAAKTKTNITEEEDNKEDENSNIHPPTTEEIPASISSSAPVPPGDSGSGGCEKQQPSSSNSARPGMTRAPGAGDEAPFQPNLNFPGRRFGSDVLRDHSNADGLKNGDGYIMSQKQTVCCAFTCNQAVEKELVHSHSDSSFARGGFCNWKKARKKFAQHELSDLHSDSLQALATLKATPISAMLSDIAAWDQKTARTVLELLFSSIKFLGREGMPLRGHSHRNGVLWQLMEERTHSLPRARE